MALGGVGIALGASGVLAFQGVTNSSMNWTVVGAFMSSPGFAGLCAICAAGLAFIGISRQVGVSRESVASQREADADRTWWDQFEWAADRAAPPDEKHRRLPYAAVVSAFDALHRSARSDVQQRAVAAVMDIASALDGSGSALHDSLRGEKIAREALTDFVRTTKDTPAKSEAAEYRLYEMEVVGALRRLGHGQWKVHGESSPEARRLTTDGRQFRLDAVVDVGGNSVGIEVFHSSGGAVSKHWSVERVERLRGMSITEPLVLITPSAPATNAERARRLGYVHVRWRDESDDEYLAAAVDAAGSWGDWVPDPRRAESPDARTGSSPLI